MTVEISIAQEATPELVEAFARLIPQLSKSSPPPTQRELAEMIATVLRAPDDAAVLDAVRAQANALCARFVPYPDLA